MAKKRFGYGDFFCTFCGEGIEKGAQICPRCGRPYGNEKYGAEDPHGAGGIGWSDQAGNPCFKKNNKKNLVASLIFMVIVCVIIYVVLIATGQIDPIGGLPIFGGVLAVLAVFWTIGLIASLSTKKDWEGFVESKDQRVKEYTRTNEDGIRRQIVYKIRFRTLDGKKKTFTTYDSPAWYDYLHEGDRVRYHGKNMSYYEKYDKSNDTVIPCASCGKHRDARETYCGQCGAILLKGQPIVRQYAPAEQQTVWAANPPSAQSAWAQQMQGYAVQNPSASQTAQQPTQSPAQAQGQRPAFCPNCGARTDGNRFCSSCGAKIM